MKIEQIYTGCLAQGAYYIESKGEAAIIDPLREIKPYLELLERDSATLKYIFETHFHADFVSGHVDLSKATGAPIIYGPGANPEFDAIIAEDGQEFVLGDIRIKALHTPGHTMESLCYLLYDADGKEHCLFSGDTLFLGDVGRPDLAQKAGELTVEDLAGYLYDSLMNKIMPLPDELIVYPAHGAGSACGKNMMKETSDTLGHQKETNYALRQPDKTTFIREVLEGLTPPPGYFGQNVQMNKTGYDDINSVIKKGIRGLSVAEFEALANEHNAIVLDVRKSEDFSRGFIPRSINIGLEGQFAPWVGAILVDTMTPILIVTYPGKEKETSIRLSRVGFDHQLGHLSGGIEAWIKAGKETDRVDRISSKTFIDQYNVKSIPVLDVRADNEFEAGHFHNAINLPLNEINQWSDRAGQYEEFYIHCAGGYRSMIAASILKSRGIHHFYEINGGYKAIREELSPRESV
ncbi:MAG: MBL fold metallo-hydrolase [Saprospiraceae bacterium]|nr:MBL fold metallo-hydrolase [Saprospiraceae bacterium]